MTLERFSATMSIDKKVGLIYESYEYLVHQLVPEEGWGHDFAGGRRCFATHPAAW